MRIESSVTSVSWIPSEAITGMPRSFFDVGITHYDDPLPDVLEDLARWREENRFRFANQLSAWIEVEGDQIVDAGYSGGGTIGVTTVKLASKTATVETFPLPDIQEPPEITATSARFVQTAGGRTGLPAPRRVNHPPFVQFKAPTVWTTLALTIRADGTNSFEVLGASKFPRHWVYDDDGQLAAKVGLANFKEWYRDAFGK